MERFSCEVLCVILQDCNNFNDLLALASTCKHIQSVWVQNSKTIITKALVASLAVQSFDDALLAVRATNIVRRAFLSGECIPRSFPFSELLQCPQSPTLLELQLVLDFRHLVRCAEHMFLYGVKDKHGQRCHPSKPAADKARMGFMEDDWAHFRTNFHRAMYRVLLSGAILYGAYNEPFDRAGGVMRCDESSLQSATGACELDERGIVQFTYQICSSDVLYLEKFAVYNIYVEESGKVHQWKNEIYEDVFGPFARWMIDDGKLRGIQRYQGRSDDDGGSQGEEEEEVSYESTFGPGDAASMEEIMLLIGAYEHLTSKIRNVDGSRRYDRHQCPPEELDEENMPRKVVVIIFGVFAMEEICMPTDVDGTSEAFLIACPLWSRKSQQTTQTELSRHLYNMPQTVVDIPHIINRLQCFNRKPNTHDGYPAPPPLYDFFVFAARRFLGRRFQPIFFEQRADSWYIEQIEQGGVFVEAELPFIDYYYPVLSYRPLR